MSEKVFLRFTDTVDDNSVQWFICVEGALVQSSTGTLEQACAALSGRKVTLLSPGTDVLLIQTTIPQRQRRRLLQSLPFALEDRLSDDVDKLHFSAGPWKEGGEVWAAVVSRASMERYISVLHQAGILLHSIIPDSFAVPFSPGQWTLLVDNTTSWLRQDDFHSFAFDSGQVAEFLSIALHRAAENKPESVRLLDREAISEFIKADIKQVCLDAGVPLKEEGYADLPEVFASGLAAGRPGIDLMQGAYSRHEQLGKLWRPWRAAAILVGILVVLHGISVSAEYIKLRGEQQRLAGKIEQLYRSTFPEARNIVNPKVQMEQQLGMLRRGAVEQEFTSLLATAAESVRQVNGVEYRALYYRLGELEMVVQTGDLQTLDRLKQALAASGRLHVEITGVNSSGNGVEGRLQIRGDKS